jgi:hypothetical protein
MNRLLFTRSLTLGLLLPVTVSEAKERLTPQCISADSHQVPDRRADCDRGTSGLAPLLNHRPPATTPRLERSRPLGLKAVALKISVVDAPVALRRQRP